MRLIFLTLIPLLAGCMKNGGDPTPVPIGNGFSGEFIDEWTFRITPYSNFSIGEFRLWLPEDRSDLKGILVLSSHHNSNGLGLVHISHWQDFALDQKLALIGVHFQTDPTQTGIYTVASEGSGSALIRAIDTLAAKHQINTLKKLPMLLRGYSAGGAFSYHFSEYEPERVIAFANIRGGSLNYTGKENNHVPGLLLIGDGDFQSRIDHIREIVLAKRKEGANWCYAVEPNTDHYGGFDASDKLVKAFFAKALAKRISANSNVLVTIPENTGWLGNNESRVIDSFNSFQGVQTEASWLIDEEFAIEWKNYQGE